MNEMHDHNSEWDDHDMTIQRDKIQIICPSDWMKESSAPRLLRSVAGLHCCGCQEGVRRCLVGLIEEVDWDQLSLQTRLLFQRLLSLSWACLGKFNDLFWKNGANGVLPHRLAAQNSARGDDDGALHKVLARREVDNATTVGCRGGDSDVHCDSGVATHAWLLGLRKHVIFFSPFPMCPEPVMVKLWFIYINGIAKVAFLYLHGEDSLAPACGRLDFDRAEAFLSRAHKGAERGGGTFRAVGHADLRKR
jgi:hypothetical protein